MSSMKRYGPRKATRAELITMLDAVLDRWAKADPGLPNRAPLSDSDVRIYLEARMITRGHHK